ncbi:MAG: hypothetical protein JRN06_08165 [Nitrososphaerota archaeon]|nr:hypothetical protein [Nitrososphaerota archaeon]MDG7024243.1 hypothetical protein [Nitrososphaerota archaeon]
MPKRYVLLVADAAITQPERKALQSVIERRHPGDRVIEVQGNPRAVIVKTTNEVAPSFRTTEGAPTVGGKRLTAVLTSGAVGNLKRRAAEAATNGQVHE